MEENIIKAMQTSELLSQDLRAIYKGAIDTNDALLILTGQLIEQNAKIRTILSQLQKV